MFKIKFEERFDKRIQILCLGAHSDDIEIGCGGSILRLLELYSNVDVYWVVFSSNEKRRQEAVACAEIFLEKVNKKEIIVKNYKDGFFPFIGSEIKQYFEELKQIFSPDVVFTHFRDDRHQDHRVVSDLTWNTYRDHLILEYEVIKYDGDLGKPNFFVNIDKHICDKKVKYILDSFQSQRSHQWFDEDTFLSMLRLRGIESNSPTKYAEAFYCRKIIM